MLGRRLDHFVAHEIAHLLTGQTIGEERFRNLPTWIKEGYAEYVGSTGTFSYPDTVKAFQNGDAKMNTPPSVPYLRYNLLVAYLLEKQKWSPQELFERTPSQAEVEELLRAEILDQSKP